MAHHMAQGTAAAQKKAAAVPYKPEFLDAHQMKSLEALSEAIVPGSTEARVAPFLDTLLAVEAPDDQQKFLGALGAFDMLAIEAHGKAWTALTAAEQDGLLQKASTTAPGLGRGGRFGFGGGARRYRQGDDRRSLQQPEAVDCRRVPLVGKGRAGAGLDGQRVLRGAARLHSSRRARLAADRRRGRQADAPQAFGSGDV